jgi:malonyl CoA-acyl carrier protein transacylase
MDCFIYPGQPLERTGLLPDDADFRELAAMALLRTGLDLETFSWRGPEWTESIKLQVYGAVMSLYGTRRLLADGFRPTLAGEHSMGIYPALAACASLPEDESIELAFRIGCATARMAEEGNYAIGCVVGMTVEPLLSLAENHRVYLANHNTSRHFLLSGARWQMESAMAEALNSGAFSARVFPCDAPLHTPLMAEVAVEMEAIFADYRYREPVVPLLNHIDQDYLTAADMADFMLRELQMPVYWENTYRALRKAGAGRFHEVGAGDSLKKYNRWIESQDAA